MHGETVKHSPILYFKYISVRILYIQNLNYNTLNAKNHQNLHHDHKFLAMESGMLFWNSQLLSALRYFRLKKTLHKFFELF
jgi:hypothetical protein